MHTVDRLDFHALFDHLPTPYMVMDTGLTIVEMNRAYLDAVVQPRENLVGRHLFEVFPAEGESRRLLQESLDRVRSTGSPDVLPMLSYGIPGAHGGEERFWSCTHVPLPGQDGNVSFIVQNSQDISDLHRVLDKGDEALPLPDQAPEEQVRSLNFGLLAETLRLHDLFMQAPSFMCILRGSDHVFELVNHAFTKLVGDREVLGKPVRDGVPEAGQQEYLDLLDNVFRTGEAFIGRKMRAMLQRRADGAQEECFLDFVYQPILGANGAVDGIFVEGSDVTDHVRSEQRQAMLIRELHHRVRNTLATVQSVMNSTARTAETVEDYQISFGGRIASLAKTHSLLTEEMEQAVDFQQLLRHQLALVGDEYRERITLHGPAVSLRSQIAVPIGLTIHELVSNAIRHGAFMSASGRLDIGWQASGANGTAALVCEWRESGGGPTEPPTRHGFGSMLLKRILTQQLGAEIASEYKEDGLNLRLVVPLEEPGTKAALAARHDVSRVQA